MNLPCDKCSLQEETALASVLTRDRTKDFYHSPVNTDYLLKSKQK